MALKEFNFNVLKKEKFARLGKIITSRGSIDTPVFCQLERRQLLREHSLMMLLKQEVKLFYLILII